MKHLAKVMGFVPIYLLMSCGNNLAPTEAQWAKLESDKYVCHDEYQMDLATGVCVSQKRAIAGIPAYVEAICKNQQIDEERTIESCTTGLEIDHEFINLIKADGICLPGATFDPQRQVCHDSHYAYGPFSQAVIDRCLDSQGGQKCYQLKVGLEYFPPSSTATYCESGWEYDDRIGYCTKSGWAQGRFTQEMVKACEQSFSAEECDSPIWSAAIARSLRGEEFCPRGSAFDPELKLCIDDQFIYGPFTIDQVTACLAMGGEKQCLQGRWDLSLFRERGFDNEFVRDLNSSEVMDRGDSRSDSTPQGHFAYDAGGQNKNTYIPGARNNPEEDWIVLDDGKWDYVKDEIMGMLGTKSNWAVDIRIVNQDSGQRYVLLQHNSSEGFIPASNNKIMSAMSSYVNAGVPWSSIGSSWFKMSNNERSQRAYSNAGGRAGVSKAMTHLGVSMMPNFWMADGSGLSYSNNVAARNLSHIMVQANRKSWRTPWFKAMPRNCVSGSTMRKMFCSGMPSGTHLRAKTGTLGSYRAVKALSGYGFVNGEVKMIFSMMYNGPSGANRQWTVGQPTIERVLKRAMRFAVGFSKLAPKKETLVSATATPELGDVLEYGSRGEQVTLLQLRLKSYGFFSGGVDGIFGEGTENAVYSFQSARGLAADGIVGWGTWQELWPQKEQINWMKAWNIEGIIALTAMKQSHCAYKVYSSEVPAILELLEKTPKAGMVFFGGEETEESQARTCPDAREQYDIQNKEIIAAPASTPPFGNGTTAITWHKLFRGSDDAWKVYSFAKEKREVILETSNKREVIAHLKKHRGAHYLRVATDDESAAATN